MKKILYFQPSFLENARRKLDGVCRYAKSAGWRVQVVAYGEAAVSRTGGNGVLKGIDIARLLKLWQPDGVLVDCVSAMRLLDFDAFAGVPSVFLGLGPRSGRVCVAVDNDAIAVAASRLLLSLDCSSYVFVPHYGNPDWSRFREKVFAEMLRINGRKYCSLELPPRATQDQFRESLKKTFVRAPKPIGVFAANDYMAEQTVAVAQAARIAIPKELLLVGVDNDPQVCENTSPTLTSVQPDFMGVGSLAAKLLEERMRHPKKAIDSVHVGDVSVCRRESTNIYRRTSDKVGMAIELIRARACDGLCASEVIAAMGTSRRLAEMRFREVVGTSILSAIQRQRVERAKGLLEHSSSCMDEIAKRCGYNSVRSLRKVFARDTGMSPVAWRRNRAAMSIAD